MSNFIVLRGRGMSVEAPVWVLKGFQASVIIRSQGTGSTGSSRAQARPGSQGIGSTGSLRA